MPYGTCRFSHVNVVKLIGVVTVGKLVLAGDCSIQSPSPVCPGKPLLVVIEFCEKGSLKGYVEDNDVPTEQQLLFALDAARGLEYCHTKKFVHR